MPVSPKLIQELLSQKEQLEKTIAAAKKELRQVNTAINSLTDSEDAKSISWTEQAQECLRGNDYVMRTIEILECLFIDKEHLLEDEKAKRNYLVGLSVALNNLCDNGTLNKLIVQGVKGHFYGLSEWFTKEGYLKPKYHAELVKNVIKKSDPVKLTKDELQK